MPLLMNIAIDSSSRLDRRISYFEYKGVRFKLVQNNPPRHSDILLALVALNDASAQQQAYAAAAEWLSATAWENGSSAAIRDTTSFGVRPPITLRQCRARVFAPPEISFGKGIRGQDILIIPHIETERQRLALALFREANSSNKVWLSILFYWQILEIAGTDPVAWVNRAYYRARRVHIDDFLIRGLDLRGRRIGECLQDEGRHAIAHIRRRAGNLALQFDHKPEIRRLNTAAYVLRKFAARYIRSELGLERHLHLVRRRGRGFPKYVDERTVNNGGWTLAYRKRRPTTR